MLAAVLENEPLIWLVAISPEPSHISLIVVVGLLLFNELTYLTPSEFFIFPANKRHSGGKLGIGKKAQFLAWD